MKRGNRTVVCVSEYLVLKPMTAKINYAVKDKSRVVDLENDKTIADASALHYEKPFKRLTGRSKNIVLNP